MWKDSTVCMIAGRQKNQAPTKWTAGIRIDTFIWMVVKSLSRPLSDRAAAIRSSLFLFVSHFSQCNFDAFYFFSPFQFQRRSICMKVCPVGNKVFYSYYSKQNYFNLRANTILHQHDPVSPPVWWSNHTDPISKHELDKKKKTCTIHACSCHLCMHTKREKHVTRIF